MSTNDTPFEKKLKVVTETIAAESSRMPQMLIDQKVETSVLMGFDRDAIRIRITGYLWGEYFGLGPGTFRHIYERELRRLRHPFWLNGLSDRNYAVATGKVKDPVLLKQLFLRMWTKQNEII